MRIPVSVTLRWVAAAVLAGAVSVPTARAQCPDPPIFPLTPDAVVTYKQELFAQVPNGHLLKKASDASVEAACVAISLAQNILFQEQSVTLFPALAGVKLANEALLLDSGLADEPCLDPAFGGADGVTPLLEHVKHFVALGGNILVCPLCWGTRGYEGSDLLTVDAGDCPDSGPPVPCNAGTIGVIAIGDACTIGPTFANTSKVVDF